MRLTKAKMRERKYHEFINMCLIQTTDAFIKRRYYQYLKSKKSKEKSKFFERMQNDI